MPILASEVRCDTFGALEEFLDNSDLLVFGGGGMFLSSATSNLITKFDSWISTLLDHAKNHGKEG